MNTKPATEIIKEFFLLEERIWRLVGATKAHYSGLEDATNDFFFLSQNELLFGSDNVEYWGDEIYGSAIFRGENYTIAVINSQNQLRPILLDNSKAVVREFFEP